MVSTVVTAVVAVACTQQDEFERREVKKRKEIYARANKCCTRSVAQLTQSTLIQCMRRFENRSATEISPREQPRNVTLTLVAVVGAVSVILAAAIVGSGVTGVSGVSSVAAIAVVLRAAVSVSTVVAAITVGVLVISVTLVVAAIVLVA